MIVNTILEKELKIDKMKLPFLLHENILVLDNHTYNKAFNSGPDLSLLMCKTVSSEYIKTVSIE